MNDSYGDLTDVVDGQVVLVTGGTGSFGQAFCRALLKESRVRKLIIFSRDEQKHYRLRQVLDDDRLRFFIGDVRDLARLRTAFRGVDTVIHTAAMKHVPMCEYNPIEAVRTNVDGARNIIEAAIEARVSRVLALSTDKAVAPANLYGATKLCMEKLLVAANAYVGDAPTRFALVRYGNVMGSAGSVIPLFREQSRTGRITITDSRMTRFWIEMKGAVELVLQGLARMTGGEIFIPKLPTTDIVTLARAVAPGVPHQHIGIRPGEKLHERLISAEECSRARDLGELMVILPAFRFHAGGEEVEGSPLPQDFRYTSDRSELRLDLDQTLELVAKVA